MGVDPHGLEVEVAPEPADIDLHSSCYWFSARISRYYTVENRLNDQQPPEELVCVSALTLGLVSALDQAAEIVNAHDWDLLRALRESACRDGLAGRVDGLAVADLARDALAAARQGLASRGLGEERFLEPLEARLAARTCPADRAAEAFTSGGVGALVDLRRL